MKKFYEQHPNATTVSLLLIAEGQQRKGGTFEDDIADVLAAYFREWSDERKADLYALLAEKVKHDDKLADMQKVVSDCLWNNENNWAQR